MSTTSANAFGASFSDGRMKFPAALLTSTSTPPKRSAAAVNAAFTRSGSRTSIAKDATANPFAFPSARIAA